MVYFGKPKDVTNTEYMFGNNYNIREMNMLKYFEDSPFRHQRPLPTTKNKRALHSCWYYPHFDVGYSIF
jgi:hypothetical protein